MTDADKARQFPSDMPPGEVAKRAGVSRQTVQQARKRKHGSKIGRPRKHTHPAEACARYLEHEAEHGLDTYAERALIELFVQRLRAGAWKEYLK